MLRLVNICLLIIHFAVLARTETSHFEGFEPEDEDSLHEAIASPLRPLNPPPASHQSPQIRIQVRDLPVHPPPQPLDSEITSPPDYWDDEEFEGLPPPINPSENEDFVPKQTETIEDTKNQSFTIEIVCCSFLITFIVNYFTGKRENENLALSWAAKFATRDSVFDKNFSLLGVGEGDDSPTLLKEGQNVFKFYASGRRYCQSLLALMELKSRHDLISRIYNVAVPCRDEITFEVSMNEDSMDHVVFAVTQKKMAKEMHKAHNDLHKFAAVVSQPSTARKWVSNGLVVISEVKEIAVDLLTETVIDQVFGEKSFEKYGKGFISMHFTDQHTGTHRKMLIFKFALPDESNMADITRFMCLIPYYIDLIGRYKLSSQVRSRTEAARLKAMQERTKELQSIKQEELQRKKLEKMKMEATNSKPSAEAMRKKEAKERTRQLRKVMPKVKLSRAR